MWSTEPSVMGQVYVITFLVHPADRSMVSSSWPIFKCHISPGPYISHPLTPLARHGIRVAVVDISKETLPNRLANVSAKSSAWCRIRRAIEAAVKVPYDEIAMADGVQLMEGLSSNIFVVDHEGTMQTAPSGKVLQGYIRHLLASQLYPETKFQAPSLDGCSNWHCLFITSSIRLVVPVTSVVEAFVSDTVVWQRNDSASITDAVYRSLVLDQYTRAGHRHLCLGDEF
jgi:branched-subunit amino acid aminotransferase/4-amino-4-deoxychorismate lyase